MKPWLLICIVLSGSLLWAGEGKTPPKTPSKSPFDPAPTSQPAGSKPRTPAPTSQPKPETVTLDVRWAFGRSMLVMLTRAATEVQPEEQQAIRSEATLLLVAQLGIPPVPAASKQSSASQPTHKGTFRFVRIAQRQKTNVGPIHDVSFDTDRVGQIAEQQGNDVGNLGPLGVLLGIPYTVELGKDNRVIAVRGFDAYFRNRNQKPIPAMKASFGNQAVKLMLQRGRQFTPDNPNLTITPGVQWKKNDLLNLPAHGETKLTMDYIAKRFYGGGKGNSRKLEIDSAGRINAPAGKTMKTQYGSATVFDLKGNFTGNIRVALDTPFSTLLSSDTRGELEFMQKMNVTATGKTILTQTKIRNAESFRVFNSRNKAVENRLFNPPKPKKSVNARKAQSGK